MRGIDGSGGAGGGLVGRTGRLLRQDNLVAHNGTKIARDLAAREKVIDGLTEGSEHVQNLGVRGGILVRQGGGERFGGI